MCIALGRDRGALRSMPPPPCICVLSPGSATKRKMSKPSAVLPALGAGVRYAYLPLDFLMPRTFFMRFLRSLRCLRATPLALPIPNRVSRYLGSNFLAASRLS